MNKKLNATVNLESILGLTEVQIQRKIQHYTGKNLLGEDKETVIGQINLVWVEDEYLKGKVTITNKEYSEAMMVQKIAHSFSINPIQ